MASLDVATLGARLDVDHHPGTNGRIAICRRCGAQTDSPLGFHHFPNHGQLVRSDQSTLRLASGALRARGAGGQPCSSFVLDGEAHMAFAVADATHRWKNARVLPGGRQRGWTHVEAAKVPGVGEMGRADVGGGGFGACTRGVRLVHSLVGSAMREDNFASRGLVLLHHRNGDSCPGHTGRRRPLHNQVVRHPLGV